MTNRKFSVQHLFSQLFCILISNVAQPKKSSRLWSAILHLAELKSHSISENFDRFIYNTPIGRVPKFSLLVSVHFLLLSWENFAQFRRVKDDNRPSNSQNSTEIANEMCFEAIQQLTELASLQITGDVKTSCILRKAK